jgi:hypothetical protein
MRKQIFRNVIVFNIAALMCIFISLYLLFSLKHAYKDYKDTMLKEEIQLLYSKK